jgi:hypothetical protein
MFFCPNCNSICDIARASTIEQKGGFADSSTSDISSDTTSNTDSSITLTSESNIDISGSSLSSPITNDSTTTDQHGGTISNIIDMILDKQPIDEKILQNISVTDLIKHDKYKKLKSKKKELVYNKIQDLLPLNKKKILLTKQHKPKETNVAYYVCSTCGPIKRIEPKTLIYSRKAEALSQNYSTSNYTNMLYSDILSRTRRYKCPNDKCESHKDNKKREAVFFRKNNSYEIKYICTSCKTSF